ncbi:hypothetical protein JZ751_002969 [Albula glossodonta]|uniref:MAT1 centre domain-containing protein n=1 Tax=Albula glossodonta TaxID=121402 RepID=A0A8T2NFZ6_9TELE|nr:hypothetical protein JZ751_002969 [Albula glossodonta]
MDDQGCPRCKTTKYRNPSLKLMVNGPCPLPAFVLTASDGVITAAPQVREGSTNLEISSSPVDCSPGKRPGGLTISTAGSLGCESCVEMLFVRGSGNCVQCDTPLRKSNFRVQLFEDPAVDKEVEIRKKVLKIYNKRDTDFPSLREYNDYLEQVEDIVFNLTNNVDVENTKQIMEQYQRENRDIIQRNKVKLESSKLPATLLLAQHKDRAAQLETQLEKQRQLVKPTIFSTGIPMSYFQFILIR